MGGLFGVVSQSDCICDLFYGTDYHSHLGTKRGGMAVINEKGRITRRIHDISNTQFRSKFDDELDDFSGKCGIGIISDYEDQPLIISSRLGTYAIVTVGKINNLEELVQAAYEGGCSHFSEMSEGEINPTEVIATLINREDNLISGIEYAQRVIDGSCSLLILHDQAVYAARDRYGRTPVVIGEKVNALAVSMESTAFPNLDYTLKYELGPGEIVKLADGKMTQLKIPGESMKMCAFFWVYFGYPSSSYEGINSEVARCRNGASLAAADGKLDIDSICGIPDSGIAHAIGYSNAVGKPYLRAFVKYTPTWPRSFMPQNQLARNLVARMKLIPVQEQIEGRKLLFCDDSIVRGTQLGDTVRRLYDRGAKEVHMRSACPPLLFGCRYLNFSQSRSLNDLAARRAIEYFEGTVDPAPEILEKYTTFGTPEYDRMVDHVRSSLNLTTLKYQKLERLIEAIGIAPDKVCTYCWSGRAGESDNPFA